MGLVCAIFATTHRFLDVRLLCIFLPGKLQPQANGSMIQPISYLSISMIRGRHYPLFLSGGEMSCSKDESEEPPGAGRRSYDCITMPPMQCYDLDWRFVRCCSEIKIRNVARLKCQALEWMAGPSVAGLFSYQGGCSLCWPGALCISSIPFMGVPDHRHFPRGSYVAISPHLLPGPGVSNG
jgi:hypothetical protein